jgi:hypothetical protein
MDTNAEIKHFTLAECEACCTSTINPPGRTCACGAPLSAAIVLPGGTRLHGMGSVVAKGTKTTREARWPTP